MHALPAAQANRFDAASASVVDFLRTHVPMGSWSVTRLDGATQVHLTTAGDGSGPRPGDTVARSQTLCQYVVDDFGPEIVPDVAAVPRYADTVADSGQPIGAYVGVPIRRADGEVFGTLCGIDPAPRPDTLVEYEPLLHLLRDLLGHVLEADLELTTAAREVEMAQLRAETDAMTGLLNRRGWDRYMQLEDERYRRYGDPCSVLVIDLDGLKTVNDTLGHPAGDELIRRAGAVIAGTARGTDVVARLGGDEFGMIVTRATEEVAATVAARLEEAFAAAGIGASIGRAALSIRTGLAVACAEADSAMYRVKAQRRLHLVS